MILLGQSTFDVTRLADYGVLGIMLAGAIMALRAGTLRFLKTLEDGRADARSDLQTERNARQNFEARITVILDQLVKTTAALSDQVGQKRESIDQLSHVITELVAMVQQLKSRPHTP